MQHYSRSPKEHSPEQHQKYIDQHEKFNNEGINKYYDMVEARDPKAQAARGSVKSEPIHADVPGLNVDDSAPAQVASAPKESNPQSSIDDIKARLAAIRGTK